MRWERVNLKMVGWVVRGYFNSLGIEEDLEGSYNGNWMILFVDWLAVVGGLLG